MIIEQHESPHPQPLLLNNEESPKLLPQPPQLLKSKSNTIIQIMLLQELLLSQPQLQPHPPPQFVAAKSLIFKSSKNFIYNSIIWWN